MTEVTSTKYTVEEINQLRGMYNEGDTAVADDLGAAWRDPKAAKMALEGPSDELIRDVYENSSDQEYVSDFDTVYGTGAFDHYTKADREIDTIVADIPDNIATDDSKSELGRAGVHGVGEFVAETAEFAVNTADQVGELITGTDTEQHDKRLKSLKDDLARKEAAFDPNHKYASVRQSVIDNMRTRITKMEGTTVTDRVPVDFESTDLIPEDLVGLPQTTAGGVVQNITTFASGMALPAGALSKLQYVSRGSRMAKMGAAAVAGFVADFTAFDPDDPTLTSMLVEDFGLPENVVTEYLTKDDDDGQLEKRFKSAIEGAGLGAIADTLLVTIRGGIQVSKGLRTPAEARDAVADTLQGADVVPIRETKASKAEADERTKANPEIADAHAEAQAKLNPKDPLGTNVSAPDGSKAPLPARPTLEENKASVVRATAFMKEFHADDARVVDEISEEILKPDGNLVDDVLARTNQRQAELAKPTYNRIMKHTVSGDPEKLDQLALWVRKELQGKNARVVEVAIRHAMKKAEATLLKAQEKYNLALKNRSLSAADQLAVEVELDIAAKRFFGIRAIDQDIGSDIGRRLQARNSKVDIDDVKADKSAPKPKAEALDTELSTSEKATKAKEEAAEYKRLTDEGIRPSTALDILQVRKIEEANILPKYAMRDPNAAKPLWKHIMDYVETFRYAAMLSGTATQATNIASMLVNTLRYTGTEIITPSTRQFGLDRVRGMSANIGATLEYSAKSLFHFRRYLSDVDKLGLPDPKKIYVIDAMLRVMTASDELFRQNWYRSELFAKGMAEGRAAGKTGKELSAYAQSRVDAQLKDGSALNRVAEQNAAALAYQRRFNTKSKYGMERGMAKIQNFAEDNFVTRLLFPFTRVAMDLMDVSVRNMPVVNLVAGKMLRMTGKESRFLDDLQGVNGQIAASRAKADMITGTLTATAVATWVHEGKITGSRPVNYKQGNLEDEAGLPPPMSIQLPNGEWISYERWEPFATVMKAIANAAERTQDHRWEVENLGKENELSDQMVELAASAAFVFAEALSTQTFAENTQDYMALFMAMGDSDKLVKELQRTGITLGESYIPNLLKKTNELNSKHSYVFQDAKGLGRHFSTFLPDYENDLRRSPLTGEAKELSYDRKMQRWNPWATAEVKESPGLSLLVEAHRFYGSESTIASPTSFSGLPDLRTEPSSVNKGRSVYDHYQELFSSTPAVGGVIHGIDVTGLTYRQALDELAATPEFNALEWRPDDVDLGRLSKSTTKKKILMDFKNEYHKQALLALEHKEPRYLELLRETEVMDKRRVDGEHKNLNALGFPLKK